MVTTYHTQLRVKSCSPGSKQPWQEFGSLTPTDLDWVLEVVIGYNTDIDTCTMTKGSTNKISAGHSLELHRAQTAERRAQSAERRAQSAGRGAQRPHKALQRQTYRSQSAMRPSPGEDRVRLAPMAHRRRDHVGEARKPKPDLRCEVNMQGKEIAPSQCTQRGSASTHSTYLALAQEDSSRGQQSSKTIAGTGAATTIRERRQLISVATSQVERGEARSHLAERHARMYR